MRIAATRFSRFSLTAVVLVCLVGTSAMANTVDFEGLITGQSVNGQAGWSVEDEFGNGPAVLFDEEVVDDGTGNLVWRFSNAVSKTSFSDQPYSHLAPLPAGESGSALWNDRGPDFTMPLNPPNPRAFAATTLFHGGFRFRSATGAAQADLSIDVSPSAKQSTFRNSFVRIVDDGANGFDVFFFETGTEADPFGTGNFPEVASDLSYDAWHTIDIFVEFIDGANADTTGNDCVTIVVDGAVVYQGTTWESFYRSANPGNLNAPDQPHRQAVDSLIFHYRGTAVPANAGNGLFFDDVVMNNAPGPISCLCGNGVIDPGEDCEPTMDAACPGECDAQQCVCPQVGACCTDGPGTVSPCVETMEDGCNQGGGLFLGVGTLCADVVDCVPLVVTMDSMSADAVPGGVMIRWSTWVETDTSGFQIMRQTGGDREKRLVVLPEFIPAAGASFGGASYEVLDDARGAGAADAYFVVDVDFFGRKTIHGPISVNRGGRQMPKGRAIR